MNENDQATKRQLWALFCMTKHDYRNDGLTKLQASEMIKKLCESSQTKSSSKKMNRNEMFESLYNYYMKNIDRIVDVLNGQLGIRSIIEYDLGLKESRKYNFVGSGCGFAWIDYDKRNKLVKEYFERGEDNESIAQLAINKIKHTILNKKFDAKTRNEYQNLGIPLEATLCQNMEMQIILYTILAEYLQEKHGIKNIQIRSRLD
jgi:hypothetical protein